MTEEAKCQRVIRHKQCGARLRLYTVEGKLHEQCPLCVRQVKGICRECPAPLPSPRHLYCHPCRKKQIAARNKRFRESPEGRAYLNKAERKRNARLHAKYPKVYNDHRNALARQRHLEQKRDIIRGQPHVDRRTLRRGKSSAPHLNFDMGPAADSPDHP